MSKNPWPGQGQDDPRRSDVAGGFLEGPPADFWVLVSSSLGFVKNCQKTEKRKVGCCEFQFFFLFLTIFATENKKWQFFRP